MTNEIKIVVTSQNKAKLDQLGKDAKKAGKEVGDGLTKGFTDGEKASDQTQKKIAKDLDQTTKETKKAAGNVSAEAKTTGDAVSREIGKGMKSAEKSSTDATKKINSDLEKTAKQAKDSGGKTGEGFGTELTNKMKEKVSNSGEVGEAVTGMMDNVTTGGAAAVLGAGLAIGGLLVGAVSTAIERENLGGVMSAQMGESSRDAGKWGALAGRVWADNYAGSLEDASAGIKAVIQNKLVSISDSDEQIRKISEMALTVAKVTDEDANAVARAAHQMLVTGVAGSTKEAFDIIVKATQDGLNSSQDLLDTLTEYSTKFRDLGLSGEQALGLIRQALDAGARDTDTAADALKELAIRAEDGSATTVRGFQTIGANAEAMQKRFAEGGDAARIALSMTLDGLRSIEDPAKRDQAAIDLFGTKAEDLGDALQHMNLHTAKEALGDVADATDKAAEAMNTSGEKVRAAGRSWSNFLGDVGQALEKTGGKLYDFGGDFALFLGTAEKISGTPVPAKEWSQFGDSLGSVAKSWIKEADAIDKVTVSLEKNIDRHKQAMGIFESAAEAEIHYEKALDDAAESVKKNGKTIDTHTEKGRANKQALLDIADAAYAQIAAMEANGESTEAVAKKMGTARDQFIDLATKMTGSRTEAIRLADQLKLLPGDFVPRVGMDASQFYAVGGGVFETLRQLGRGVTVPVSGRVGAGLGFAHGGVVGHAAEGGPRGSLTLTDEQGPELKMQQDGSMIVPAGMSRAIMSGWMGGSRGGGTQAVVMELAGNVDSALGVLLKRMNRDGLLNFAIKS